ncbi:MAG: hypothetical protein HQL19_07690, partial [Candidatus Omnitrophica bacterium]|nr:hypothetical protein [Candidatus Omnitrophota bacterium]
MGVTYKLTEQVIQHILARKAAEPSLSVRALVGVVWDECQVRVSKSSVSAVVKERHLNNPVGRRARFKAPKNFSIPVERKEILRAQISPLLAGSNELGAVDVVPRVVPEVPAEVAPEPVRVDALEKDLTLLPDPCALPEDAPRVVWNEPGDVFPNMGIVFLLAALWEKERAPLLGEVLGRALGVPADRKTAALLETIFCGPALGCQAQAEAEALDLRALDVLLEGKTKDRIELLSRAWHATFDGPVLHAELWAELETMSGEAAGIRALTTDNKEFFFDPWFLSGTRTCNLRNSAALFQAIDTASDVFISNIRPVALCSIPGGDIDAEDFQACCSVMNASDGWAVDRLEILGGDGAPVFTTPRFHAWPRGFFCVERAHSALRARLLPGISSGTRSFTDLLSGHRVLFTEGSVTLKAGGVTLRTLLLQSEADGKEVVILSNIHHNHVSGATLARMANIRLGGQLYSNHKNSILSHYFVQNEGFNHEINQSFYKDAPLSEIIRCVSRVFEQFWLSAYLPEGYAAKTSADIGKVFYGLSGWCRHTSEALFI